VLKQRLQRERDGRKKVRLQMLYLLVSEQAHTRQEVAQLLGVSRNTVGRWLALYETGGLAALLDLYIPPGKRPSLAPDVLASIEQVLRQPRGFSS
jgi:transposase